MLRVGVLGLLLLIFALPVEGKRNPEEEKVDVLLLEAADTTLSRGKRVGLMEEAARYDPTGRAMHALGRYYLEEGTVLSRQFARRWLQRAMRQEPGNGTYRMTYAELFRLAGAEDKFFEQVRQVVALDPNNEQALYWAGKHAAQEMMLTLERETLHSGPERKKRFNYGGYGKQMRDQAIGYLSRLLRIDSNHKEGRILLGQVYVEGHMAEKLVSLFDASLKQNPDDRDAYFFSGLGYQAQGKLSAAFAAYSEGMRRMSELEQQFISSIVLLADQEVLEEGGDLPGARELQTFWKGRDPLFMTGENERLLEHYRRVAYANLRFGDPEHGREGWETDRGRVYIRFGKPGSRNLYLDRANYILLRETWSYPGFSVTFERISNTNWKVLETWMQGSARSKLSDLIERVPEFYEDPYWKKRYNVPFQVAQFRGEDGQTRVEIYYALPGEYVRHRDVRSGVQAVDLKQGMFLFDEEWNEIQKSLKPIRKMPWVDGNAVHEGYLFWGERLMLDAGVYRLGIEAEDQAEQTLGTFRDALEVQEFGVDRLQISGLLTAQRIVEQEERPFGRDRFMVLPNPFQRCQRDASISFYFEVYNLKRDEFGATEYQVTYQMRLMPEKWVEGEDEPEWTTAVSHTYKETRPWEPHQLTLDMEGSSPGPWAFRVVVDDLKSGEQAATMAHFRVMP